LGLPSKEGLLRNCYVGRTFIQSGAWGDRVHEKFSINRSALEGKKVILVEDSVVRGNTMRELVQRIREEGGAREVHARIACPPILNPCFYGIDMSTFSELIAAQHFVSDLSQEHREMSGGEINQIKRDLGVDSLIYLSWDGLLRALRIEQNRLCMACLNGQYGTKHGQILALEAWKKHLSARRQPSAYEDTPPLPAHALK
jgi:amidophosphoribosyltransferase